MLYLLYWETTDSLTSKDRLDVAEKLSRTGLFSGKKVEIVRWDTDPDGCDILVVEADSEDDVHDALETWRAAAPGFFKFTKAAPLSG